MKNFSNETKSKRRKAVAKVVLKRYSFIVWLPLLLYILNVVGSFCLSLVENYHAPQVLIGEIGLNILYGLIAALFVAFISIFVLAIIRCIVGMIGSIRDYLQRKTFLDDVRTIFRVMAEVGKAILSAPKKLYQRVKDEKRRFNDAVERQIEKENRPQLKGEINH